MNETVRNLIKKKTANEISIGYIPGIGNHFNLYSTFSTYNEIYIDDPKTVDLYGYHHIIEHLLNIATEHNTRLFFALPLTNLTNYEKVTNLALYHSIHDSLKIEYSEDFLNLIEQPENLFDKNHFNLQGATLYSTYLCEAMADF